MSEHHRKQLEAQLWNIANTLRLCWLYLRDYSLLEVLLNLLFWYILWLRGAAVFGWVLPLRLLLFPLTLFVHRQRKRYQIYFYSNNGLSERRLLLIGVLGSVFLWLVVSLLLL